MPDRTVTDRTQITDRSVGTIVGGGASFSNRSAIADRGTTGRSVATQAQQDAYNAQTPPSGEYIGNVNTAIIGNAGKYVAVPWSPYNVGAQATVVSPTDPGQLPLQQQDALTTLSDVFRSLFGNSGDVGQAQQTGQALVPVTSTTGGGGSSIILIILIVGIVGFVAYRYYKKHNG